MADRQAMRKTRRCHTCNGSGITRWTDGRSTPCSTCRGSGAEHVMNLRWNPFRRTRLFLLLVIVIGWLGWVVWATATQGG